MRVVRTVTRRRGACGAFLRRAAAEFVRARRGAAMLLGGVLVLSLLGTTGGLMSNYAWREAQQEELRAALRAAVSAAGPLLAGAGGALNAAIEERIGDFLQALVPGLALNDVDVGHDAATGVTTISVDGEYTFQNLLGGTGAAEAVAEAVRVKLESDRYEVAVALDISVSMSNHHPGGPGPNPTRLGSLKVALHQVADVVRAETATTPGSLMVAMVPFTGVVNVADTATDGPAADKRTPAKERYVRMLAGPHKTVAETLQAAERAGGQWVDTFHHYGVGDDLGPLRSQSLPQDLLDGTDWNLRRTGVDIDVSAQVPDLGTWTVDDRDFWNGCVMARWGAYWHASARPAGWNATDASNWPVARDVKGWSDGSGGLPSDTPVHLSDAPPDANDPHTLFTAYSWPDARIGGFADHRLQGVMAVLLDTTGTHPDIDGTPFKEFELRGDNDWSIGRDGGGSALCPESSIMPLTDDVVALRKAVDDLTVVAPFPLDEGYTAATTYPHIGVVWGLRVLSPLWREVWDVQDLQNAARPGVPCARGESTSACDARLNKSILLITDGDSNRGSLIRTRLAEIDRARHGLTVSRHGPPRNPPFHDGPVCWARAAPYLVDYHAAAVEDTQAAFDGLFSAYLDAGKFGDATMPAVLDAFHTFHDRLADTPATRDARAQALKTMTPWGLFRGLDADTIDKLMDSNNQFGFDGRPVQTGQLCSAFSSPFGPYGRIGDHVYVGETATLPTSPIEPVADVAPLSVTGSDVGDGGPGSGDMFALGDDLNARLDDWFVEACGIAGERGVRINAIFIGRTTRQADIAVMEDCVDAAGGDPGEDDVFVTPDAASLGNAFAELFTVRRNLRFVD